MITDGHDPMNYPDMIESLISRVAELEAEINQKEVDATKGEAECEELLKRIAELEEFIRMISNEDRFAIFGVWPQHAKELLEQGNEAISP